MSSGQLSTDSAREILRRAALRCTPARIAVLQCLHRRAAPLTPVEIVESLADYGFDKSTIYRSLSDLDDAEIVTRLDLGDSVRRFELSIEQTHPHFMCTDCGQVVCLAEFTVELRSGRKKARPPGTFSEVLVRGQCTACES